MNISGRKIVRPRNGDQGMNDNRTHARVVHSKGFQWYDSVLNLHVVRCIDADPSY